MLTVENIEVYNIENAMRGMRNPLNSWAKNDTVGNEVGENDRDLAKRLLSSGTEHAKFMRQIFVTMDITAPLYWWKEMDTYKIGTTANSCSTMHTIHKKPFELKDFSRDGSVPMPFFVETIEQLEQMRQKYLQTKDKELWRGIIQLLPCCYNQKRTWTGSYANLANIYKQRQYHKLSEWHQLIKYFDSLPMGLEWLKYGNDKVIVNI